MSSTFSLNWCQMYSLTFQGRVVTLSREYFHVALASTSSPKIQKASSAILTERLKLQRQIKNYRERRYNSTCEPLMSLNSVS